MLGVVPAMMCFTVALVLVLKNLEAHRTSTYPAASKTHRLANSAAGGSVTLGGTGAPELARLVIFA